jgi:hypothetical protein
MRPRIRPFSGGCGKYFEKVFALGFDTLAGARCSTGGRSLRLLRDLLNRRQELAVAARPPQPSKPIGVS